MSEFHIPYTFVWFDINECEHHGPEGKFSVMCSHTAIRKGGQRTAILNGR